MSEVAAEIAQSAFAQQEDNGTSISEPEVFAGVEATEHTDTEDDSAQANDDDQFSRKFAALSRQDREFRQKEAAWKDEREELDRYRQQSQDAEAAKDAEKPTMPLEHRLRRDPLGTLAEMGLDYEMLTSLAINDGKMTPEMQMKLNMEDMDSRFEDRYGSKIKALEDQLAERDEQEKANIEDKAVVEFQNKISSHLSESPADYELITANEAEDLVYDVIAQHYESTDRILDIKDAAEAVEQHLMEEAEKLFKLDKISKLRGASQPQIKPEQLFESPTTLSNVQSAQTPKLADRKLTNEESKASAAQLIRWDS